MNLAMDGEIRAILLPLLQEMVITFRSKFELPLRIQENARMSMPPFVKDENVGGCGIAQLVPHGKPGAAPCHGKPELIIFIYQDPCDDDVLVCRVIHPLQSFAREVEGFVLAHSPETLSRANMRWRFSTK